MSDIEQRLQKLEDRFVDGEISEAMFKELRERLLARQAGGSGSENGQGVNIADSVVRGDIRQTTNQASGANVGGGIHVKFVGGHEGGRGEVEYESFVLAILHGGGALDAVRQMLDERRQRLGLTLATARSIEAACLEASAPPVVATSSRSRLETIPYSPKSFEPEPGEERTIELPGGVPLTFCWCPATTDGAWKAISGGEDLFWMGSPEDEMGHQPNEIRHPVRLTQGF